MHVNRTAATRLSPVDMRRNDLRIRYWLVWMGQPHFHQTATLSQLLVHALAQRTAYTQEEEPPRQCTGWRAGLRWDVGRAWTVEW